MPVLSAETLITRVAGAMDIDDEVRASDSDITLLTVREIPGGFQRSLNEAFIAAQGLYKYAGLKVIPDDSLLDEEATRRLSGIYELMNSHDFQPEVVVAREGLDLQAWRGCWQKIVQKIHEPVIISGDTGPGSSPSIEKYWDKLKLSPDATWTVGVVAANPEAPLRNVSHDLNRLQDRLSPEEIQAVRDSYPSMAEYLSLQATRYLSGRPPIDLGGSTWLLHTIDQGSKAPTAQALPEIDTAAITCAAPDAEHSAFGIRLAFREELQLP